MSTRDRTPLTHEQQARAAQLVADFDPPRLAEMVVLHTDRIAELAAEVERLRGSASEAAR